MSTRLPVAAVERASGRWSLDVIVLAALIPVAVLAVDSSGWYLFGPVKWAAVSTLCLAGAALALATRPVSIRVAPTLAAAALVAWLALPASFGSDPLYAWIGTPERHFGVVTWALCFSMFLVGQSLTAGRDLEVVVSGATVAGAALGVLGMAEALGWEPAPFDLGHRLTGPLGSAAYLGAAAALLLPVAAGTAFDARLPRCIRRTAAIALGPLVITAVGTGTRAAWLGLLAAAVLTVWLRRADFRRLVARPRHGPAIAVGLGGVVVVAVALALAPAPAGSRVTSLLDRDAPGGRSRLDEWGIGARVVADHPLLGVGPEGYRIAFGTSVTPAYERAHGRDPLPDRAHAGPLDIAAAGGLPALGAWLVLAAFVGRASLRAIRRGRPAQAGIAAALVAHAVTQLFLFPLAELEPIVWLLAGVVVALDRPLPHRTAVSAVAVGDTSMAVGDTDSPQRRMWIAPRWVPAGLGVLALVALAAGTLDIAADREAAAALRALDRGDTRQAALDAERAARLRPDIVRLRLLEAQMIVAANEGVRRGLAAVDAALELSPGDPIARLDRAQLLVARARATHLPRDAAEARGEIDRYLADDPNHGGLWLQAGAAAQATSDDAAAEAAWRRAEQLEPRSAAPAINLALLYLDEGRIDAARGAIQRALHIAPDDARAQHVRALIEDAA